jgi:hypothetical protein
MYFGFLGRHGVRLADNETYVEPGDLTAKVTGFRSKQIARQKALKTALAEGKLRIERMCPMLDTKTGTSTIKTMAVPSSVTIVSEDFDPNV